MPTSQNPDYTDLKEYMQRRLDRAFERWGKGHSDAAMRAAGSLMHDCKSLWRKDGVPPDILMPYYEQAENLYNELMNTK